VPNEYQIENLKSLWESKVISKIFYSIKPKKMEAKKKLVLHHSATPRDQDLLTALEVFDRAHYKRFVEPYSLSQRQPNASTYYRDTYVGNIAYNFVISADGEVAPCRPLHMLGYHCGDLSMNRASNAICCLGNFENETPTQYQLTAIRRLQEKYKWEEIYGHKDIKPTACPGKNFPLQEMKALAYKNIDMFYKKLREVILGHTTRIRWVGCPCIGASLTCTLAIVFVFIILKKSTQPLGAVDLDISGKYLCLV